ncbi:MAG: UDP-2,3-diacylglucosamine diphosphatase LpxI domain-containing protein [Hyphomicrobium sp.]
MSAAARRIGILAGGGSLPLEFARAAARRGELARIVALDGAAERDFADFPVTRVGMGQLGRMLAAFRSVGTTHVVIIGPALRPDLKRIRPDLGFFRHLPAILRILASGGDDGVLRGVVRFFEAQGFAVIGPADVAPETLAPDGVLSEQRPDSTDTRDIARGFEVIRALGDLDVGQAVIVHAGVVEAIEGAEGTDRMLQRVAASRGAKVRHEPGRGVLVKRPKPGQELRVDMPSIGPGTITRSAEAGLSGVAVLAGGVLVAERAELVRRAAADGLFVIGLSDDAADRRSTPSQARPDDEALTVLGRCRPSASDAADAATAVSVMAAASPFGCGNAVVVARGYVLAVEAGAEGADGVLDRIVGLGRRAGSLRKRRGVLLLAEDVPLDAAIIAKALFTPLSGIIVTGGTAAADLRSSVIAMCDAAGIFMATRRIGH